MGAPRANSTTAHTPLFFSLPPSSCVYRSVIMHSPSVSLSLDLFLFVIFWYFFPLISCASSSSFPFCCRSVVLRLYLRVPWHSCVAIFFLLLFYFPHYCVFHITIHILSCSVSFYLEKDGRKMAALLPVGFYF